MKEDEYITITDLRSYRIVISALQWMQPAKTQKLLLQLAHAEVHRLEEKMEEYMDAS